MADNQIDYKKPVFVAWERTSKKGNLFLSVKMNDKNYIGFRKENKTNPKAPDWEFFESEPMSQDKPVNYAPVITPVAPVASQTELEMW